MESVRHQVFVSSTFLDLKEERAAVVSALLQMEAFPAGMELFPAADENAWVLITEVIDDSDYYLLVIGGKYGSIDPETELSFTEKEYDYATEAGKPVMAFLRADPDEIPLGKSEKDDATRKRLESFRAKVEADKHVKYWTNADELAAQVTLSFASLRKRHPTVGWVRGNAGASPETLAELNDLRKQLAEADAQRSEAQKGPPPGLRPWSEARNRRSSRSATQPRSTCLANTTFKRPPSRGRSKPKSAGTISSPASLPISFTRRARRR
jgi:hypothetical protein